MVFIVIISLSRNRYFSKDSLHYQDLSLTIVHRNAGSIRSVTLHYSFHISFTIHLFLEIDRMGTQHAIFQVKWAVLDDVDHPPSSSELIFKARISIPRSLSESETNDQRRELVIEVHFWSIPVLFIKYVGFCCDQTALTVKRP